MSDKRTQSPSKITFLAALFALLLLGFTSFVLADTVTVEMRGGPGDGDFRYSPSEVLIKVGDTVLFVNNSPSPIQHTATYGMGSGDPHNGLYFDTGFLAPGASFSVTFDRMGMYPYYCIPHEFLGMTGLIRVGQFHRQAEPFTF